MEANKLRAISERALERQANDFWKDFSVELFKTMETMADGGSCAFKITSTNELNTFGWLSAPNLYTKVIVELRALGYDASHSDNMRDGTYIYIKW